MAQPCSGCQQRMVATPVLPSGGKLAWNYLMSMRRLLIRGASHAPLSQVIERLKVCESCELRVENRCSHPDCGCYLDVVPKGIPLIGGGPGRAQYAHLDCPLGKWPTNAPEPPKETTFSLRPKHLLYHIYPIARNGTWQRNVKMLLERIEQFDGKRCVAIVIDQMSDPPEWVYDSFSGHRIDQWHVVDNNPKLREVVTWNWLWEQVASEPGITFYGHAKGVTRPWGQDSSIGPWTEMMYRNLLDYPEIVDDQLRKFETFGVVKKLGLGFVNEVASDASWHYSGTFFWVRNDALKEKWKNIDQHMYGNESWVGINYPEEVAGAMVTGSLNQLDLYRVDTIERVIREVEQWKSLHAPSLSGIG